MSQEQLQRVQSLITQGRFDEARAILQGLDRPEVPQLLAMLERMEALAGQADAPDPHPDVSPDAFLDRLEQEFGQAISPSPAEAAPAAEAPPAAETTSAAEAAPAGSQREFTGTDDQGRRVYHTGTYEMLWDCQYCGATKLLGKTHRFCPNCGAAQNPDARYFPSEAEQVAVEDHRYVGADRVCPACDTLNSASAEFCGNCGSALTDAARAKTLGEQTRQGDRFESSGSRDIVKERFDAEMDRVHGRTRGTQSGRKRRPWLTVAIIAVVLLCIGAVATIALWTNNATVYVTGHSWERVINVEQFGPVSDSAWCDSMPADAYSVTRRQEQRSVNRIPDGETCQTVRVDQGDGTFRTEERCQTRYREEPVYDDKCYYTVDRWTYSRSVNSTGASLDDTPYWPQTTLNCEGQSRRGCEREQNRDETYTLYLRNADADKDYECGVDFSLWQGAAIESNWTMEVGAVLGDPRCGTLERAG